MASLITVRLNKDASPNWGFRLQGGMDFGTPLIIQKVNSGTPAERAGLVPGDSVIKINNIDVFNLRHKDAQDVVVRAGNNFDMTIQRGGSTWKPQVIPTGTYATHSPTVNNISPVTKTSLHAKPSENIGAIGTGHNVSAKPFGGQVNGSVNGGPKLVNKQYNSPLKIYSEQSIAETLSAQTEVLSTGALGVNFKKNEKDYDATKSAVYHMLQEAEHDPRTPDQEPDSGIVTSPNSGIAGLRHVSAPENRPKPANPQLPPGQNICADCERLIVGVFVRIKDKNLHVECFKCATCGSSLKNVGYYNINNKLYCDIHAKAAVINNPPSPNLVPVTVQPGGKVPATAISAALASHSLPSPSPLSPKTNSFGSPYQPQELNSNNVPATPSQSLIMTVEPTAVAKPISNPSSPQTPTTNNSLNNNIYNNSTPLSFSKYLNKSGNLSSPKPFSSVSAPTPQSTLPRPGPLSPRSPVGTPAAPIFSPPASAGRLPTYSKPSAPLFKGRCVSNVIWPPPQEEQEFPTACPLYFPPPSQVEAQILAHRAEKEESEFSYSEYTDYEEMAYYQQPKLSICSEEISGFIERKSATECIETISESLETQKLVESVMKTRPRSPPPLDTNVIPCSESIIQNVPCCQKRKDSCELKRPTQFTPNTLECQLSSQIPNPVPQGWESPMLQALRIAPDAFSQIPSKRSSSALASALKIAPAEPFTPAPTNILDPVPLPEETVPYFPPEHAIVIEPKEPKPKTEKKPESQFVKALAIAPDRPFTPVGGVAPVKKKVVDPLDKFIQELPKPQEKLTMTTALTTAPDRPYTPIFLEQTELNQSITQETRTKEKIDRSVLTKPLMPAKLPDSFHPPQPEPKPILKELPPILIQETEEKERKNEQDTKHVRIIEKHELKPAVPATITKYRLEDPEPPTTHFAPIFQGFSCSYQDKQFSVEVVTTPPILTPTPTEKSHSASSIAISEGKSGYIQKETIREETSSRQKSSEKQVRQMTTTRPSEVVKQAEQIVLKKPLPLASALHPVGALPQYQVNLSQEAEAEIKRMEKIEKAQIRLEQQKIVQQESHNIAPPKPIRQPSHEGIKKPIITLQPGDNQPMRSQTFKPVIEDKPASTTFSPRPRSITPSMINKSPAVLPYYQANLVAHHCPPPTINLLDPTSPAISRSPSPCPGARERSPSPFPGSGAAASRPKSPAAGPPPNPLRDIHPLPTPKDSKVRMAKENLTTFIPQYKEKRDLIEKVQGMDFYKRNDELSSQSLEEQYNQQTQMTQTQQWQEQQQIQQTQQSQQHQIQQQQIQKQQVLQMQKSQQQQIQQQQQDIERQQIQHEIQRQQQKHAVEQQRLQQGQPIQMYTSQVQTQNYSVPQTQQFETSFMACQETSDATSREKKMQMQNVQIQDSQKAESHSAQTAQGSITTSVSEKSHQEHLEDRKCSQKQSVQTSADGRCQIQRKQTVTEEYEHSQKAKVIEIQKNVSSSGCKKHPFRDVNPPIVDQPGVMGLHLTNPQPLSSPFIKADNCGSLPQLPQVDPKSVCPPCVKSQIQKPHPEILNTPPPPPVRKVFAPGSQGPIKHVKAPGSQQPNQNVIKSNVPSSNIGSSSGRQISAIGAPRRGRGVLNAAAIGGARIPLCGQCHKQIRGPFITALGKIWCPDHFICTTPSCRRPLQDIGFVEEHGQLYCEYCFEQYLAPPCSKCNGKIKGDCLKAIGKNFHPECFNCVYCGKLFGNNPFFLEDGNPYCEADWNELFTTKCYACGFPVEAGDRWVEALNNNYHSQCFNCTMCKKNLEGQSFFAKGGRPFCKTHAR